MREALDAGIACVTEDRKQQGLLLPLGSMDNITVGRLKSLSRRGWIDSVAQRSGDLREPIGDRKEPPDRDAPAAQVAGRIVMPGDKRETCKQSAMWLHSLSPERWIASTREPSRYVYWSW